MKYLVTPAPHKHKNLSTTDMYFIMCAMLLPCIVCALWLHRIEVLYVLLISIASVTITEFICASIKNKKFIMTDFSFLPTALVLTCIMPLNAPLYMYAIAGVIAIVSKYLFGGIGNNLFNPSALGRGVIGCLFTGFSFEFFNVTGETTLQLILGGYNSSLNLVEMITGGFNGAIGTTCIVVILVAAVVLAVMRIIKWESMVLAVGGFVSVIAITLGANCILPMLFSGSFLFVTVFMLTDPTTSPYGLTANALYGLLFGVLAALFMRFNIMGETAVFLALLVANFTAPAFDRLLVVFHKGVKLND